jgi:Family of unknown function (DUF6502)
LTLLSCGNSFPRMPVPRARSLTTATGTLLKPLVRILLRNGVAAKSVYELVKHIYVQVAKEDFGIDGKKATISRVAILTGLTRKEVQAILALPARQQGHYEEGYNRAARVITGWLRDADFGDGKGHPAPLPMIGKRTSFTALVKRYSGDIPVRALLDELVRVGAVKRLNDGRVGLVSRGYVPQRGLEEKLAILGNDTADLIATIDHNIFGSPSRPRMQRKVMYDNVPVESARAFQTVAEDRAQEMLEALDRWLSHRDRDVNPTVRGKGRVRVGVGIYHFEERLDDDES